MASRFATVTKEEISQLNEEAVTDNDILAFFLQVQFVRFCLFNLSKSCLFTNAN